MPSRQFFHFEPPYNVKASMLLAAINYNVTPPLSNELRYRATIIQSITRILDLLTFRSRTPSLTHMYNKYQNIWKKNSLTTDSPFSISRQRPTGTVESAKQIKRKRSFIDHTVLRSYPPPRICRSPVLSFFLFHSPALALLFSLLKTGQMSKCAVDRSQPNGLKRGSDKGLSLWVTVRT